MVRIRIIIFLSAACFCTSRGCHADARGDCEEMVEEETGEAKLFIEKCEDEHTRRRRNTETTEDFMTACMTKKVPSTKGNFMPTLVSFMIHHTEWYAKTGSYYCEMDTVDCWKSLCSYFLKWESMYVVPVKTCIEDYGISKGRAFSQNSHATTKLSIDRDIPLNINVTKFLQLLKGNLPPNSPYAQLDFKWQELIEFYMNDYVCSVDFCNCTGLNLSEDEKCGQSWLSRLVGSTKITSGLRSPLLLAANGIIRETERRQKWVRFLRRLIYLECVRLGYEDDCYTIYPFHNS